MNRTEFSVFDALRRNDGLTKSELLNLTGVSSSSLNNYLNSAQNKKYLDFQAKSAGQVGRKLNVIRIRSYIAYSIGIDIGGWETKIIILDLNGETLAETFYPSKLDTGPEKTFQNIGVVINKLMEENGLSEKKIISIGLSMSAFLETDKMLCRKVPFFTEWDNINIKQQFDSIFPEWAHLPIFLKDSARTMTLAEQRKGLGQETDSFFLLNLGAGIGGGLVLNNQVFWGENGFATEVGHIRVSQDDRICICGKQGCLETYASSWALRRQAENEIKKGVITSIKFQEDELARKVVDASPIFHACSNGDRYANTVVQEVSKKIAQVTSIITQLVNPKILILTGGVVREIPEIILDYIKRYHEHGFAGETRFAISKLTRYSGAIGAALYSQDQLFLSLETFETSPLKLD